MNSFGKPNYIFAVKQLLSEEMLLVDFIPVLLLLTYFGTFGRKRMNASKRVPHILISVILLVSQKFVFKLDRCASLSFKVIIWGGLDNSLRIEESNLLHVLGPGCAKTLEMSNEKVL